MKKQITKVRSLAFILYPESLPFDWKIRLTTLNVPMAISPLHDRDEKKDSKTWDDNNDLIINGKHYKKRHYHILYCAHNPVTMESVRLKVKRVLGENTISHVEIVDSVEHYYKYLTHESSDAIAKHKHVYDSKDISYISNFDINRYITLDESQKKDAMNALLRAVLEHRIANIFDLNDFIVEHGVEIGIKNMDVANEVIKGNTGLFRLYFDGAYQRNRTETEAQMKPKRPNVDVKTGEIIDK